VLCKGAASVKQVVVIDRKLREAILQWTIAEDLSQGLLHYRLQHGSQDAVIVNSNTVTLTVPAEESSVIITAVYRLNGSGLLWDSAPVTIVLQPFGKSLYFVHTAKINISFSIHSP